MASINSIQRGTITIPGSGTSATATITSVNISKSRISHLGGSGGSPDRYPRIQLTNSTTITATNNLSTAGSTIVSFEVVEYL